MGDRKRKWGIGKGSGECDRGKGEKFRCNIINKLEGRMNEKFKGDERFEGSENKS